VDQKGRYAVFPHARNYPVTLAVDAKHLLGNEPGLNRHTGFAIGKAEGARVTQRRLDGLADPPQRFRNDVGGHSGSFLSLCRTSTPRTGKRRYPRMAAGPRRRLGHSSMIPRAPRTHPPRLVLRTLSPGA